MRLAVAAAAGWLALAAPARASTTYTPSPTVAEAVRREFLAGVAQHDPAGAAALAAAFAAQDPLARWARIVEQEGLHPGDVADAVAADWMLAWLEVHGRTDDTAAQAAGVRRQVARGLEANAAFQHLDDPGRQRMAEAAMYDFAVQFATFDAATKRGDKAALTRLAAAAQARMLRSAHLDMRQLALTDAGLVPPKAPTAVPGSAPPKTGAVDRVVVAHWFGITPTGLSNTYDLFVLFDDGVAVADPAVPPAELGGTPAAKRGRWARDGATVVFTWPGRKPGQQTVRKKEDELSTCRPAEPDLRLEGDYSHTGGSGPIVPGGIVTLSEASLHLHRDGTFTQGSATAVGGAGIGGGVTAPNRSGRYRLDGYVITFDRPGATPERRFFCRYTDDDKMVFIGSTPWLIR